MNEKSKKLKRRWWLAGLLSYILPGLGQVYNGQVLKGLFFNFIFTLWGGIVFTLTFYTVKQEMTGFKISLLFLALLVSFAAHLCVIIESIWTARKKDLEYLPKIYNKWYIYLAVVVITLMIDHSVATAVKENVIKPYQIVSGSMEPSLQAGDFILSNQIYFSTHNPERGDIILFKYPVDEKTDFIKRIIGVPGDTIEIRNKQVWINSKKLEEPYVQHTDSTFLTQFESVRDSFGPFLVSPNCYFVMGDDRDTSLDSRHWGTVKRHQIKGKLSFIYFSLDGTIPAWKLLPRLFSIRLNRIGKIID
jgi:signal peptidase I